MQTGTVMPGCSQSLQDKVIAFSLFIELIRDGQKHLSSSGFLIFYRGVDVIPAESDTEPDIRRIHLSGDPRQLFQRGEEKLTVCTRRICFLISCLCRLKNGIRVFFICMTTQSKHHKTSYYSSISHTFTWKTHFSIFLF